MKASYLQLDRKKFARRIEQAKEMLRSCTVCPRECKVNRLENQLGFCKSGKDIVISSFGPHYGEEPPISGKSGSGTIFFTGCNLRCVFCQNYQISQEREGRPIETEELANAMIHLQDKGCHNINWVSPTHFVPHIMEALFVAIQKGLTLPIVYNTNGYDSLEILKLLDGIVDIYLPDIKYSTEENGRKYSGVDDYVKHNRIALKEMHRQVGTLKMDANGIAQRGLLIRHLVLPNKLAGSLESLNFVAQELSPETHMSLMSQYHPCYKACDHPDVRRRLNVPEYNEVVEHAEELGLENCFIQELHSSDDFLPDFKKEKPFER